MTVLIWCISNPLIFNELKIVNTSPAGRYVLLAFGTGVVQFECNRNLFVLAIFSLIDRSVVRWEQPQQEIMMNIRLNLQKC